MNICDTDPAALLRAQNTCVYVTSHLIHSEHGSGAVIVAPRKSDSVTEHWKRDLLFGGAERSEVRAWSRELRETAGVKTVKRERAKQSDSDCRPSSESNVGNLCGYES